MAQIGLYPKFRADDRDGLPLEGGKLYSYLAGTSTPQSMYADEEMTTPLSNPIILDASGEALFYSNGTPLKWILRDADDVLIWEIDPVTGTGSSGLTGLGVGCNTVALSPLAGAPTASALVFPADVLAIALTVWVQTTLGASQGLAQVGIGSAALPDSWGVLETLTATSATTAGHFLSYGGQPQPATGQVQLTAYGGLFDGTGQVFLTGYYFHFTAREQVGMTYLPGAAGDPAPPPVPPAAPATELQPGVVELINAQEVVGDVDLTRAVTIGRLVSRTGTPTRVGLLKTATPEAAAFGSNDTDAVTPLGVKQALTGTSLSVPRYASGGGLEATPGMTTSSEGRLGIGRTPDPGSVLTVEGAVLSVATDANAAHTGIVYSTTDRQFSLTGVRARGTEAAPLAVAANDILVRLGGRGHDGASFPVNLGAWLDVVTEEAWTGTARGSAMTFNTTLVGTTTQMEALRLTSRGNLTTRGAVPGTGMQAGLVLKEGVGPSAAHPADAVQLWVENFEGTAGQATLHLRSEDGFLTRIGSGLTAKMRTRLVTTNVSGTPLALTADMSGMYFICQGTGGEQYLQLPAAPTANMGVWYRVSNHHANGVRVMAGTGATIQLGATVTAAGGYFRTTTAGNYLLIVQANANYWMILSPVQNWGTV